MDLILIFLVATPFIAMGMTTYTGILLQRDTATVRIGYCLALIPSWAFLIFASPIFLPYSVGWGTWRYISFGFAPFSLFVALALLILGFVRDGPRGAIVTSAILCVLTSGIFYIAFLMPKAEY